MSSINSQRINGHQNLSASRQAQLHLVAIGIDTFGLDSHKVQASSNSSANMYQLQLNCFSVADTGRRTTEQVG